MRMEESSVFDAERVAELYGTRKHDFFHTPSQHKMMGMKKELERN
jgi:hypothetical protein